MLLDLRYAVVAKVTKGEGTGRWCVHSLTTVTPQHYVQPMLLHGDTRSDNMTKMVSENKQKSLVKIV